MSAQRYWVIGGDFSCMDFKALRTGTETILGPFDSRDDAKCEWQRVSLEHKSNATARFSIVSENAAQPH